MKKLSRGKKTLFTSRKLIITGILLALFSMISAAALLERTDLAIYDTWFKLHGVSQPPRDIAIIAIDDRSIKEIGAMPWPRKVYARLINRLKEARVIGFDLVLDTPGSPEDNDLMATAMKAQGKVVLGSSFSFEQTDKGVYQVPVFPVPKLAASAAGIGFTNVPGDIDNVTRRITVVDVNMFKRPFPCFNLAVFMADRGLNPNHLAFTGKSAISLKDTVVPVDKKNQTLINFWGPGGTFKTYSFLDVLEGRVDPGELSGKIVLVGATSAIEKDIGITPFTQGNMILTGSLPSPGVEIHASAIATYLTGGYYIRAPLALNLLFLAVTGLLAAFIISRTGSPLAGLLGTLVLAAAFTALVFLAWHYGRYWLNLASPLGMTVATYVAFTAENLIQTELDHMRTRSLFGRYVSPAVVEELLKHNEEIALGGTRMHLSILFSDIRGFTSFSENKQPEYIIKILNEYFTEMTEVIFKYGGTLDKYMGDGIMAFFGAPVQNEDHADRALATAREMVERLAGLNKRWQETGGPALDIGIGINSGPVVVGNIGSPKRMDYTIIGEDVNLASRLESMNKELKTKIILSDRTVSYLINKGLSDDLMLLGKEKIRGMNAHVCVYTVKL